MAPNEARFLGFSVGTLKGALFVPKMISAIPSRILGTPSYRLAACLRAESALCSSPYRIVQSASCTNLMEATPKLLRAVLLLRFHDPSHIFLNAWATRKARVAYPLEIMKTQFEMRGPQGRRRLWIAPRDPCERPKIAIRNSKNECCILKGATEVLGLALAMLISRLNVALGNARTDPCVRCKKTQYDIPRMNVASLRAPQRFWVGHWPC